MDGFISCNVCYFKNKVADGACTTKGWLVWWGIIFGGAWELLIGYQIVSFHNQKKLDVNYFNVICTLITIFFLMKVV